MDSVASLYGRNNLQELITKAVQDVYIPITVGGGIRSLKDAYEMFRCGADKIAVNTVAVKNPNLITELVKEFGSQSIVISLKQKKYLKISGRFTQNVEEKNRFRCYGMG